MQRRNRWRQLSAEVYRRSPYYAETVSGEHKGACPNCGGTDRFRVHCTGRLAGVFACRQCEPGKKDPEAFRRILEALGLSGSKRAAPPLPPDSVGAQQEAERKASEDEQRRLHRAAEYWTLGGDPEDTPAAVYLRDVRLVWPSDVALPATVRWLPRKLLPYTAPADAVGAILWQYAWPDGSHRATGLEALTDKCIHTTPRCRRTFGAPKGSLFVVPADEGLLQLCEGPVDALAARWLGQGPAVATGGTSGLKNVTPATLPGVQAVHIHVDADSAGRMAANAARQALMQADVTVTGTFYYAPTPQDPAEFLSNLLKKRDRQWSRLSLPAV